MTAAWATAAQVRQRAPVPAGIDDPALVRAIDAASSILARLSTTRPVAETTVSPRPCDCWDRWGGTLLTRPGIASSTGQMAAVPGGPSPFYWRVGTDLAVGDRTCPHELVLPDNPVLAVTAVRLDGVLLDPSTYELIDARRLRRKSGPQWWSAHLGLEVTYTHGSVDEAALLAVSTLATELAKAGTGGPCALPQRVTSLTRQGVSFALLDPQTFLTEGRTGLYLVDLFLTASMRRPNRSAVRSPDVQTYDRRRTSP